MIAGISIEWRDRRRAKVEVMNSVCCSQVRMSKLYIPMYIDISYVKPTCITYVYIRNTHVIINVNKLVYKTKPYDYYILKTADFYSRKVLQQKYENV